MSPDPLLVWGAGAIGGTLGAYLVKAGRPVTFVDVHPEHVHAVGDGEPGLTITGLGGFSVRAPAFTPDRLEGRWKRVLLAVKGQDTERACRALLPHLDLQGYVASFQNGLCSTVVADIVGRERTVAAFVNFGADWIGPGEIHYGNRAAIVMGELDGTVTERVRHLHEEVRLFEPDAVLSADVLSYLWGKMAYSALLTAQALGDLGIADCLERPELLELWRALAGELVDLARAEGIAPRGFNGFAPNAFGAGGSLAAAMLSVDAMVAFNRPNAKTHSGVWRDLAVRKRRTEVSSMFDPAIAMARRRGLAIPKLERLVAMIGEIEDGARAMDDANLEELAR